MSAKALLKSGYVDRNLGPVARTAGTSDDDVRISYEFFPPKTEKMEERLWSSIAKLEQLDPD